MTSMTAFVDMGVSVYPDPNARAFARCTVTNEADSARSHASHYSCEACHQEQLHRRASTHAELGFRFEFLIVRKRVIGASSVFFFVVFWVFLPPFDFNVRMND